MAAAAVAAAAPTAGGRRGCSSPVKGQPADATWRRWAPFHRRDWETRRRGFAGRMDGRRAPLYGPTSLLSPSPQTRPEWRTGTRPHWAKSSTPHAPGDGRAPKQRGRQGCGSRCSALNAMVHRRPRSGSPGRRGTAAGPAPAQLSGSAWH
eukprot:357012-Chlamydomonas_euryale.AAC.6